MKMIEKKYKKTKAANEGEEKTQDGTDYWTNNDNLWFLISLKLIIFAKS